MEKIDSGWSGWALTILECEGDLRTLGRHSFFLAKGARCGELQVQSN
jgi:hypothetical protein